MPKEFIRRYLPDRDHVKHQRHLQVFGELLHDPNLWHLNRRSVSGAFAVGLFIAFIPIPLQMVLAAAVAMLFRVNLPISIGLVWITNPLTIPPIFYFTYRLGTWMMGVPMRHQDFELSWQWMVAELAIAWKPFLLGSFVTGTVAALLGYFITRGLWRLHLVRHFRQRKAERLLRERPKE